jgi:hypothetical protein
MMWYLQLFVEWVGIALAQDAVLNLIFAALALWAGSGKWPATYAICAALIYVVLIFV